ncbi:MAG: SIR2 family protein [Terriglobia bacterium]
MSLFLIGAGFNSDAKREVGPVFGNSIHAGHYKIDCGYPLLADVAHLCFGLDKVPTDKSIEDLFGEALERKDYEPLKKLSDRLMEADFRLAAHLAFPDKSSCYSEFFKTFREANFLTFNYDSLPEIFLYRRKSWYPHDGYGLPVRVELSHLADAGQFARLKSTSLVLHLHGSFCVYADQFEMSRNFGVAIAWLGPRERPIYGFDADSITPCFDSYRRAMSTVGHVPIEERVIAPIRNKAEELKQPFINETYAKAFSLVRKSGTLFVVGYSFNHQDSASYAPILEALSESHDRKLVIVSPEARNLADKIKGEYDNLRITPIDKTFKAWAKDSFRYKW